MRAVVGAFRLEVWVMKSAWAGLGLLVAVSCASALAGVPFMPGSLVSVSATLFTLLVFSVHEKNRTSGLYGFVPLRRRDVVAGRYLLAAAVGVAATVVALATDWFLTPRDELMPMTLGIAVLPVTAGWLMLCFTVALAYPVYFWLGFARGMFVTPVVGMVVVGLGAVPVVAATQGADILGWASDHPGATLGLALAGGLVVLAVSALVAAVLYQRKDQT